MFSLVRSAKGGKEGMLRTFAMQEERLPASCRARSRRRSYSASALDEDWWLKAGGSGG